MIAGGEVSGGGTANNEISPLVVMAAASTINSQTATEIISLLRMLPISNQASIRKNGWMNG